MNDIVPYEEKDIVAMDADLRREVKDYITSCESLLCSSEAGTALSKTELHLIELYAEAIDQSLLHRVILAD